MRLNLLAFAAPLVLLCGCATTPQQVAEPAPPLTADTAYGMFLAGNAALAEGRSVEAARFLDIARVQSGQEGMVLERAFTAALLSGDIKAASLMAPDGPDATEPSKRLGKLVLAVEALADGRGKDAFSALGGESIGFPHRSAAALLRPWAAAAAGETEASLVRPAARGDQVVEYFGYLNQAFLHERARHFDEAETDFKVTALAPNASELAIIAYGGFLERRGRRKEAMALYDEALTRLPTSLALKAARAHTASNRPATPAPTLREGAALALLAPAASMISAKQTQIGLAYLRLTLRLDPTRNDAWLMIGDFLQGAGDLEGARAAYVRPRPGSPEYGAAQAKLAWSYQNAGDPAEAIKIARAAADGGEAEVRMALADILRANKQDAEAVEIMTQVIDKGEHSDSRLYFARGIALERMGRWRDAEADLLAALKLKPDDTELLNYLGYSWIDRGERLPEALVMVEKAVAANPRSGAMVDSLGWAYFRLGDYKRAVQRLEQAIEFEAGDPDINNHLGDAYWMSGRKDEAIFQWRRVLTLDPDAKTKADAEAKLAARAGPPPAAKIAEQ